jgi:hypothetical protein
VRLSRRRLILGALALSGLEPRRTLGGRARAAASALAEDTVDDAAATAVALSGDEIEDLVAFGEVLVASEPLRPEDRASFMEYLEIRSTQGGGYYRSLYRTTVSLLRRLAGTQFSDLEMARRMDLVGRHRLNVLELAAREDLGRFPEEVREVRTRAAPDLIAAYYASPAGWAAVGYTSFPGQCGDLTRYTRAED